MRSIFTIVLNLLKKLRYIIFSWLKVILRDSSDSKEYRYNYNTSNRKIKKPEAVSNFKGDTAEIHQDIQLKALFTNPDKLIKNIQRLAAKILMREIGAHYLPSRLILSLEEIDACQAVRLLLHSMGMDYATLLQNKQERKFFNDMIGVIIESDNIRKELEISDLPLYAAIKTHDRKVVELYIERLHQTVEIINLLKSNTIVFPHYYKSEFYQQASALIDNWDELDDMRLADLYKHYKVWRNLQEQYEHIVQDIDNYLALIYNNLNARRRYESTLNEIDQKVKTVRLHISNGKLNPSDSIQQLQNIYEEVKTIYQKTHQSGNRDRKWQNEGRERTHNEELQLSLDVLNLHTAMTLDLQTVKKAYRRMALKLHPDVGGDAMAFNRLQNAYRVVRDHLALKT